MAATSVENGGEIFIMTGNSQLENPFPSALLREKEGSKTGSLRSTHSMLRGLNVFVDPTASASLPRDVEMSVSLYENKDSRALKTSSRTKKVDNGDESTVYRLIERSSTETTTPMVNGVLASTSSTTAITKSEISDTNKNIATENILQNGSDIKAGGQIGRVSHESKVHVKKAGSFQFKTTYPAPISRSISSSSEPPGEFFSQVSKEKTVVSEPPVSVNTKKSTVMKKGSFSMSSSKTKVDTPKSPQDMTLPLKIATSGNKIITRDVISQEDLSVLDSTKSLSHKTDTISGPNSAPPVKDKKPDPVSKQSSTTSLSSSVSASLSPHSSVSSVPTVVDADAAKVSTETDTYLTATTSTKSEVTKTPSKAGTFTMKAVTDTSQPSSVSISRQDSGSVFESVSQAKSEMSSQQHSNTSTLTSVTQISETSSIVKNKEFKSRMNMMIGSNTASLDRAKERPKPGELNVRAATETNTEYTFQSQTFPRDQKTEGEIKVYKSMPTSPIDEMKDTITSGKVGNLAKSSMFKHLTGRMMDPSTMERKRQQSHNTDPTSPTSPTEKKYRFVVEGIDVPEKDDGDSEKKDEDKSPSPPASPPVQLDPDGIPLAPPPPPPPPGYQDTMKQKAAKRGFSYVIDEKLANAILKKAEDVTARKPHEAIEDNLQSHRKSTIEESDVLVEAKAKLHKRDSLLEIQEQLSPKPTEDPLIKEIKARFGNKVQATSHAEREAVPSLLTDQGISSEPYTTATYESHVTTKTTVTHKDSHSMSFKAKEQQGKVGKSDTYNSHKAITSDTVVGIESNKANLQSPPAIYVQQASIDSLHTHESSHQEKKGRHRAKAQQNTQPGNDSTYSASTSVYSKKKGSHSHDSQTHAKKTPSKSLVPHDSGMPFRKEDATDSNSASGGIRRAISQQDIIQAALTSDAFRQEYKKNNVFSSGNDDKPQRKPSVTRDNRTIIDQPDKYELPPDRSEALLGLDASDLVSSGTVERRGGAIKTEVEAGRRQPGPVTQVRHVNNITTGEADTTTTWNLKVDVDDQEERESQHSSVLLGTRKRVPYENIRDSLGIIKIDFGETEIDEVDQEVRNVTGLHVDIQDEDTRSGYSSSTVKGGILIINKSPHSSLVMSLNPVRVSFRAWKVGDQNLWRD